MSSRITKERCFECRYEAALIAIMAMGAFSVYGIIEWRRVKTEAQIVKERIEDGANEKAALRFPITALSFASISIFPG